VSVALGAPRRLGVSVAEGCCGGEGVKAGGKGVGVVVGVGDTAPAGVSEGVGVGEIFFFRRGDGVGVGDLFFFGVAVGLGVGEGDIFDFALGVGVGDFFFRVAEVFFRGGGVGVAKIFLIVSAIDCSAASVIGATAAASKNIKTRMVRANINNWTDRMPVSCNGTLRPDRLRFEAQW